MKKISQAVLLLLCSAVLTDNAQAVSLHKQVQAHQETQQGAATNNQKAAVHKEQIKLEVKNLNQNGKMVKETKQAKAEVKQETKKQAIEQTQKQLKNNEQVAKKKVEEPTVSAAWVAMAEGVNEQEYMAPEMDALKEQQVNKEFENPHADEPARWTLVKEKPVPAEPVVKEAAPVPQSHVHPVVAAQAQKQTEKQTQKVEKKQAEVPEKHDSWHKLVSSMDAKDYGASQASALEDQEVNVEFNADTAPVAVVQKHAEHPDPVPPPTLEQETKIAEILTSPGTLQQQHDAVKATVSAPAATSLLPATTAVPQVVATAAATTTSASQKAKATTAASASTSAIDEKKAKIAAILMEPISQSEQASKIQAVDEEFSDADIATYGQQQLPQSFTKQEVHNSLMDDLGEIAAKSDLSEKKILAQQTQLQKEMEDEYAQFGATLDPKHYDNALKILNELKIEGNPAGDELLRVSTKDIFKGGFKMFPQVANNQYVQDQLTYLEGAQDNLNQNFHNRDIVNAFIATGQEVAHKLENQFSDFWNNPLPQ